MHRPDIFAHPFKGLLYVFFLRDVTRNSEKFTRLIGKFASEVFDAFDATGKSYDLGKSGGGSGGGTVVY